MYRSAFEQDVASFLEWGGVPYKYEDDYISFVQPAKKRRYTPDFFLNNGVILEVKGRLTAADRQKHKWIKEQFPDLDIRFVFMNPNTRINKGSKTRYRDWADKLGIPWCKGPQLPTEWTKNLNHSKHTSHATNADQATL